MWKGTPIANGQLSPLKQKTDINSTSINIQQITWILYNWVKAMWSTVLLVLLGDRMQSFHCWHITSLQLVVAWQTAIHTRSCITKLLRKKAFPYSISSVGLGDDPGVQAVSPQVTVSHPPGGRLPLFSARSAVTSPVAEHHRPLASTKLYCLVTEAHRCEQLAQRYYAGQKSCQNYN